MIKKVMNSLTNPVAWVVFIAMYVGVSVLQHKTGISKLIASGQSQIDGEESFFDKINPFD